MKPEKADHELEYHAYGESSALSGCTECPVCKEISLEPGDTCDVGVGWVKCAPDHCPNCGYVEQGPDPSDKPIEHYRKCWEEGVSPHDIIEQHKGEVDPKYQVWIDAHDNEQHNYGNCRKVCHQMVKDFPELTRVYGRYMCYEWGERHHFWCIAPDGTIVDPTSQQFPSAGMGLYCPDRYYPLELDNQPTEVNYEIFSNS